MTRGSGRCLSGNSIDELLPFWPVLLGVVPAGVSGGVCMLGFGSFKVSVRDGGLDEGWELLCDELALDGAWSQVSLLTVAK